MKVYITSYFRGRPNRQKIRELSAAVRDAQMDEMWFVRDVEHYKHMFDNPKDRWEKIYDEIGACDLVLIEVSDGTNSRRAVELGMALALRKPVIIAVPKGVEYKNVFAEIATAVIEYETYKDITQQLKKYDKDLSFNVTDKMMLFAALVLFGFASAWGIGQYFLPLGIAWTVIYWVLVRRFIPMMKLFDRVIIYIPLGAVWLGGIALFYPISGLLAWGWALAFWFCAVVLLQKLKLSL